MQLLHDGTVGSDALANLQTVATADERLRFRPGQIEHLGHSDAPDFQNITEALGGYQAGLSARSLQNGVRRNGGPMQDLDYRRRRY